MARHVTGRQPAAAEEAALGGPHRVGWSCGRVDVGVDVFSRIIKLLIAKLLTTGRGLFKMKLGFFKVAQTFKVAGFFSKLLIFKVANY